MCGKEMNVWLKGGSECIVHCGWVFINTVGRMAIAICKECEKEIAENERFVRNDY